jgi:two-component system, cell cycle response regulator
VRVLIAEDDAVSRTLLKKAVERFGHECLTAEDGEKAWELFRNTPEVDVVISDWMMPGIDGLELCRRIRQASRLEYTFFIFLTVLGDKKHLLEGMRTAADDYLAKPLDGEQLQARLIAASRVTSLHRKLRHEIAERKRAEELIAGQTRHAQLRTEVSEVLAKGGCG